MKKGFRIPMNLQLFAEGGTGGDGGANSQQPQNTTQQAAQTNVQIDYARIQQMLDGTLAAKEDTALKAYFKQQGLSQQEAEQAMATFKAEKAKNTPDVGAIQSQLAQAQAVAQQAELRSAAMMQAVSLGIDANTIPYVLKLADFSQATGQDGKISDEALKAALNKVLEDVPALKPQASAVAGFVQLGAPGTGSSGTQNTDQQAMLSNIFGIKKK